MFIIEVNKILINDVLRKAWPPEYAMEKGRYVRQIFGIEHAFILSGVLVVVILVKFDGWIQWLYAIFSIDSNQVDRVSMNRIIPVSPNCFDLFWLNLSDWQVLKDLDTTCSCPPPPSHCKNHGRQLLRNLFLFDFGAYTLEVRIAVLDIKVFVRAVAVQKRSTDTHLHDVLSEALEKINGACHPRVLAKGYQPIFLVICNFFVVDEADILLEECVQSRHVVQLSLNKNKSTLIVWEK